MAEGSRRSGTIGSSRTLIAIVNELQRLDGAGVTELAENLEYTKGTIHKHLKTLEQEQYVTKADGVYRLGLRFLTHGGYARDANALFEVARPKVRELAEDIDELVLVTIKDHDRGVFVYRYNDRYEIHETNSLGTRYHLHTNAAGKAILARLSDREIRDYADSTGLPKRTANTVTSEERLFERIERIRERGLARNREERSEGIQAIAAAIEDEDRGWVGAVSAGAPAHHFERGEFEEQYAGPLLRIAKEIELAVMYGR